MSKSKRAGSRAKKAKKAKKGNKASSPLKAALGAVPKKRRPKAKCCLSKPRCRRCPLVMLKDGTLPDGLAVQHRRVVARDADPEAG